jgi:hypothetical protein
VQLFPELVKEETEQDGQRQEPPEREGDDGARELVTRFVTVVERESQEGHGRGENPASDGPVLVDVQDRHLGAVEAEPLEDDDDDDRRPGRGGQVERQRAQVPGETQDLVAAVAEEEREFHRQEIGGQLGPEERPAEDDRVAPASRRARFHAPPRARSGTLYWRSGPFLQPACRDGSGVS